MNCITAGTVEVAFPVVFKTVVILLSRCIVDTMVTQMNKDGLIFWSDKTIKEIVTYF